MICPCLATVDFHSLINCFAVEDVYHSCSHICKALYCNLCHRKPSPGLSTETVTGLHVRTLYRNNTTDNMTMHAIADMLQGGSDSHSV